MKLSRLAWVVMPFVMIACTKAELFGPSRANRPDRVRVKGSVCTSDPAERGFPVKVLFLVDTSVPEANYINQRADSIEKVLRTFPGANYSFGVIRYAGPLRGTVCGFRNLTPDGFTKNLDEAIAGVRCTDANLNPGRDLSGALSLANSLISGDVLQTPLGQRSRTKYVVVLLANGPPTTSLPEQWCNTRVPRIPLGQTCDDAYFTNFCEDVQPQPADCERYQYTRIVRDMRDFTLDNGAQEFFFHVVYQRDPDDALAVMDNPQAVTLFAEMALNGGGTLYRFETAGNCDLAGGDTAGCVYSQTNLESTQAVFQRKQLIVSNRSTLPTARGLRPDTDGDGLFDEREVELGTSPYLADTDGDFLSDRTEVLLQSVGLDPLIPNIGINQGDPDPLFPIECPIPGRPNPIVIPPDQDTDGDGLTDCEEILFASDRTLFDSDADGIPDSMEFRAGTNMISDDGLEDTDADGLANLAEFRFHLAPLAKDPSTDRVYRYEIRNEAEQDVISYSQPFQATGVFITAVSENSSDGRATLYFDPPPDPTQPVSEGNPGRLAWRDPNDTTPSGSTPGRGPDVLVTGDGSYTLQSAGSNPLLEGQELSVTVLVVGAQLPQEPIVNDLRLRTSRRVCFDFEVSEIQLRVTGPQPDTGQEGVNFIDVFLAEVPQNNPDSYGVFRVATRTAVLPPNKDDWYPQPDIELNDLDFLIFGD